MRGRSTIICIVCLLSSVCALRGQTVRTILEDFRSEPEHWTFAQPIFDTTCERKYTRSGLVARNFDNRNRWLFASRAFDGKQDWSVESRLTVNNMGIGGGVGVIVISGDLHLLFVVSGRGYSISHWRRDTGMWLFLHGDGFSSSNKPSACSFINPLSVENSIAIIRHGDSIEFRINEKPVAAQPLVEDLAPLATEIDAVGLVVSGRTTGTFSHFRCEYHERIVPYQEGLFTASAKSIVHEFVGNDSRYPVMAPNGQSLYFVMKGNKADDDIWTARATSDSTWSEASNIGNPVNNASPNNVVSVSQDGNELVVWGAYKSDGSSAGGGLSVTRRTANGWTLPTILKLNHQANRATSREECFSADRSVLIAARKIDGSTIGDKDLYVSFLQPDGSYSTFTNLGSAVNTSMGEHAPFLAADGRTMYWHSYSETFGNSDIFTSKRLDDTWLRWSPRVNLGPHINTPDWDAYFTIHPSGRYAYMNTTHKGRKGIHRISIPQDSLTRTLLPEPVVVLRGRVLDATTKSPLGVDIRYENLATATAIGTAVSAPADGQYSIVLRGGANYGFFAEKDGYFPVSDNIELNSLQAYAEVERDLFLEPIVNGAVIRLNNLFFDTDKATIRPESVLELDRLVDMLAKRPTVSVSIEGHTDDRGTPQHNNALSKNRANAVREYLTNFGIDANRLSAQGFGKAKPLVPGTSDSARMKNRRVEFRIVSL